MSNSNVLLKTYILLYCLNNVNLTYNSKIINKLGLFNYPNWKSLDDLFQIKKTCGEFGVQCKRTRRTRSKNNKI